VALYLSTRTYLDRDLVEECLGVISLHDLEQQREDAALHPVHLLERLLQDAHRLEERAQQQSNLTGRQPSGPRWRLRDEIRSIEQLLQALDQLLLLFGSQHRLDLLLILDDLSPTRHAC